MEEPDLLVARELVVEAEQLPRLRPLQE